MLIQQMTQDRISTLSPIATETAANRDEALLVAGFKMIMQSNCGNDAHDGV
jgi:hypothetical protein